MEIQTSIKGRRLEYRQAVIVGLAIVYLVVRFGFTTQLDALGEYASYLFEVCCVALAIGLSPRSLGDIFCFRRSILLGGTVSLIAGFGILKAATSLGFLIPFDLTGMETILLLLLFSPILEEFIFRFFLWQPVESLTQKPVLAWIGTSVVFSYSHLHTMWFVPADIHPFIIFQTIYTLFLGFFCGYFVYKYKTLLGAILVHFFFNLGFYLASLNWG
jgi:membrane protease YdiL (CAAX protease family)